MEVLYQMNLVTRRLLSLWQLNLISLVHYVVKLIEIEEEKPHQKLSAHELSRRAQDLLVDVTELELGAKSGTYVFL